MKDETAALRSKLAKQKTELARMGQDRSAHLAHILRLKRILRNALEDAPGWRSEAETETSNIVERKRHAQD